MDHGYATSKYRINKARSLVKALNSVKDEKSEPVEFWGRKSDGNLVIIFRISMMYQRLRDIVSGMATWMIE